MDGRRFVGALLALLLVAAGCAKAPEPTAIPSATATPSPTPSALSSQIEDYIADHGTAHDNIRSIRVQVEGTSRLEHYRHGVDANSHLHVFSVTKSVISILIGIAIADGKISGTDATLAELLPDHRSSMTEVQRGITLEQLLTMSGGLADDEQLDRSTFEDSTATILKLPLQATPGREFVYSNVSAHLVSTILAEAVGESPLEYGRKVLFDPLGIDTEPAYVRPEPVPGNSAAFRAADFAWATDADGVNNGCCLLKLTADDMVALGQLYLDQGRLDDRVLLPADWVTRSVAPSSTNEAYGLLWWLGDSNGSSFFAAVGAGGQVIVVMPERRAVVTVASEINDQALEPDYVLDLIEDVIVPTLG